ncbi:MAG TPA: FhaA domain-containing protein, partial [Solirubrobacteraceae bacterium]
LSEADRRQFEGYEADLREELSAYLLEHARREKLALVSRPEIGFKTDERLRLGEFGIQARLVRPDADPDTNPPAQGDFGHTMVHSTADRVAQPLAEPHPRRSQAKLRLDGRTTILPAGGVVLGRSRDCDLVVDDPNVSRRHAEVRPSGGAWTVRDLGSTNGIKINGRRVDGPQSLHAGDTIEMGTSRLTFELE